MSPLAQILLAAAGTYLLRISFVVLLARVESVPARVELALQMIPPAVLGAIVAQGLFLEAGSLKGPSTWWLAAAVAGAVGWRTRNVLGTIATGMATLWLVGAVV